MELKNIKAAAVVVRTIREDWNPRTIEAQLTEMADNWPHADVLYAAVVIASDMSNQFPATLSMKARQVLERLHAKTTTVRTRTGSGGRQDEQFLCDICSKNEAQCQTAATNLNGSDHAFVSIRRAEAERDRERANPNPETAAHKQAVRDGFRTWGARVAEQTAELNQHDHPEPEQESA